MATIQIKRKTSDGTGPLIGNGTIKSGEPLIDLNGGNLYIAKADKTNNLVVGDYIEFYNKANADTAINSAIDNKIESLNLGTASNYDVGHSGGQIPVIDSDGYLPNDIIPQIAITDTYVVKSESEMLALNSAQVGDIAVRTDLNKSFILKTDGYSTLSNWQELLTPTDSVLSVNGKTGTVTISLSELGGVFSTDFSAHKNDGTHLTTAQKTILANVVNNDISKTAASMTSCNNASAVTGNSIAGAIRIYSVTSTSNSLTTRTYTLGIDSSKVLSPSSTIDGGTY